MNFHTNKKNTVKLWPFSRGFTIVESLVAITILMIAIVGPLTVSSKALTSALDAKNEMIATNLAQEELEYIKNYKDNYINPNDDGLGNSRNFHGIGWVSDTNNYKTDLADANQTNFTGEFSAQLPDVTQLPPIADTVQPHVCSGNGTYNCRLNINNVGYTDSTNMSPPNSGTQTVFTRYFVHAPFASNPNEDIFTVTVSWNTGTVQNRVRLVENMTTAQR